MVDLISVIIPIYKVERWIEECVDSVLAQTYGNLEIILVDDGSPDRCPEICEAYALRDSRVKVIHKSNGGLSSARNAGLDIAQGEYIVFVDSDDYIHPQMIEQLYKSMEENQADLSMCGIQRVSEEGIGKSDYLIYPGLTGSFNRHEILKKLCGAYWIYCVVAFNKMYRKKLWENYRYPIRKIHEDEFAIHHIVDRCEKVVCTEKCYYYYRQREGSIMAERSAMQELDVLEAFLERQIYFKNNGMIDCMVLQDCRWFTKLCDVYCRLPKGKEWERYRYYQVEYYRLHKWIMCEMHYPILRQVQVVLYMHFPSAVIRIRNCYRSISTLLKKAGMVHGFEF